MNKIAYYIFDRVINNSLSSLTNRDLSTALHVSIWDYLQKDFHFRVTHSSLLHFFPPPDFALNVGLINDVL